MYVCMYLSKVDTYHMHNCRSHIVYNYVAAVIEEVSSKPFGADPQVMMSIVKGLYSLKPGDVKIINELLNSNSL